MFPQSNNNVRMVLGLTVEGTILTAFVNGQPVMQATDTALAEGSVGVGAIGPSKVSFSEVDFFIPSKASFVSDRRASFSSSKSSAATEGRLPPLRLNP